MEKNSGKWGERIRIIGVSMDESPKEAIVKAKEQGWKAMELHHVGD